MSFQFSTDEFKKKDRWRWLLICIVAVFGWLKEWSCRVWRGFTTKIITLWYITTACYHVIKGHVMTPELPWPTEECGRCGLVSGPWVMFFFFFFAKLDKLTLMFFFCICSINHFFKNSYSTYANEHSFSVKLNYVNGCQIIVEIKPSTQNISNEKVVSNSTRQSFFF